ncbi:MAG: response regulator [Myxococcota bacterium]|nr:response regulator [Myxococcota bacterium]
MASEQGGGGGDSPTGVRVLIVDDDEVICRQLASGLANVGYQVMVAHDGAGALAQALETPPDVAVVDLELPTAPGRYSMGTKVRAKLTGLDVIRQLKEQSGPAVHVMVMTGHDDEAIRRDAFDAGTDDFVVKPTGLAELKRRLAAATRTHRAFVEVRLAKEAADRRMTYGAEATALLAHDLNNGLAVALGNVQYLAEELTGLDADKQDALSSTIRSLRRMSGLVANFVDIARFEDAAVKPIVQTVRVATVLESVLEVNASLLSRSAAIKIDCPDELESRFDAALVERVLHNLVGNAARYCNQGGQIVVCARPWNDVGTVELSVTNSGPQIPENIRDTLFGKYVRGGGGKRGMGLYFCRLVAEAHGGRIDYEAAEVGPRFVMRLPGRA